MVGIPPFSWSVFIDQRMLRLTTGQVPTWQLLLTLAIMGLTAVVIIRAAARNPYARIQ